MIKSQVLHVRIQGEIAELFKIYADKNGITRSRILQKIVAELVTNEPNLVQDELIAFRQATRQLAGAASNLNQLTRSVNSGAIKGAVFKSALFEAIKRDVATLRKSLVHYVNGSRRRWVPK